MNLFIKWFLCHLCYASYICYINFNLKLCFLISAFHESVLDLKSRFNDFFFHSFNWFWIFFQALECHYKVSVLAVITCSLDTLYPLRFWTFSSLNTPVAKSIFCTRLHGFVIFLVYFLFLLLMSIIPSMFLLHST